MIDAKIDVKRMKKELLKINPTLYCSARAHLRGKLHMSKVNGGTLEQMGIYCWRLECVDDRRHMFCWTMENQAEYVNDVLEDYVISDKIEKKAEEHQEAKAKPTFLGRILSMIVK